MRENLSQSITRDDVKTLLTVITIILAIAFAWSDLKNTSRNAADTAASASKKTEDIAMKQDKMALDIVEIKTILKQRGLTQSSYKSVPFTIASTSTPAAQSAQLTPAPVIVNNYIPTPTSQPTPTNTPTPTPTPTPASTTCVIGICLGG